MSLNDTPMSERIHIGFFGIRNAGKSSLVNRITNQEMSLVSEIKGTTTDPVKKSMELLPLGPVTVIDTPGYDDEGTLGEMRIRKTKETLGICDMAILVTDHDELLPVEEELLSLIKARQIPYVIVQNKIDLEHNVKPKDASRSCVSAADGTGIRELKDRMANAMEGVKKEIRLVADLLKPSDIVVLVIPIDTSAPKGRLILPQQLALRDILEAGAISVVTGVETLPETLHTLGRDPALVITDSQAFANVTKTVPERILLTSFSILMARYKGFLKTAIEGAKAIDHLPDRARILIAEGCTHHRQCEDIGTVKLPKWLKEYTGKEPEFDFTSGHGFTEKLQDYDLVIHCGACMLNDQEVRNRMQSARDLGVRFTNYGTAIAHMNGILDRSIAPVLKYI